MISRRRDLHIYTGLQLAFQSRGSSTPVPQQFLLQKKQLEKEKQLCVHNSKTIHLAVEVHFTIKN